MQIKFDDASPHFSFKFFIDNDEVEIARQSTGTLTYKFNAIHSFRQIISIGSDDVSNGQGHSWNSTKTLKIQAREGASNTEGSLHQHVYFYPDTTGGNFLSSNITVKPQIQITSYGSKTVIDGFTLTNATDNRIVTSTGLNRIKL